MKKLKLYILVLIGLFGAVGSFATPPKKKKPKAKTELTEKQTIALKSYFIEANKEKLLGNRAKAESLFLKCVGINDQHAASYFELGALKYKAKDVVSARDYMQRAYELNPDNKWYAETLAFFYEKNQQYDEAAEIYELLIEKSPGNIDYYESQAAMYLYGKDVKSALKVYNKAEDVFGVNEMSSIQKHTIYTNTGKTEKAIAEIEKLIKKDPYNVRYYTALADMYSKNKQDNKAMETYQKLLEIDPNNGFVQYALAMHYRKTGEDLKSEQFLDKAFANPGLDFSTKAKILLSDLAYLESDGNKVNPKGLAMAKVLTETHPENPKAFALYGDLLNQNGDKESALENYTKSLKIDKSQFLVWGQRLILESDKQDWDLVYKSANTALEYYPSQPTLYYFKGIASIQNKNYQEAIDALEMGKAFVLNNDNLLGQFYSNLADAYHNLEKHKDSDKYFDKALQLNPNDDLVLNNYSYYLSVRGEKLEKAASMSKIAVENNPKSSTYIDTYAWILYKQGDYENAKVWMEKALNYGGNQEGVLLEHYGDILFRLNDVDGAMKHWKKAKATGSYSEFLDKKIESKSIHE